MILMDETNNYSVETGCEGLFFQLFMANQCNIYAYILASIHNYSDADDIFQETATVMWRRFNEFKEGTSFVAWGIAIARNQILKYFNERKRSRIQFDDDLLMQLADLTLEETSRIVTLKKAFRKCLGRLSEINLNILQLRYKDGMTIKAVANSTGKPIHGMYKTFARLQDALQRCIESVLRQEGQA